MRAEAQYMTGDIPAANITLYGAFAIAGRSKQWGVWLSVIYLQIRIEMAKGNWEQVEDLLRETADDDEHSIYHHVLSPTELCMTYVYCKLGQPDMLANLFAPGWDDKLNRNFRAVPSLYAIHAEVMLVRKEYVPLLGISKKYLEICRFYPNLMVEITLSIVIASAYEALADRAEALAHLRRALELALPDGIVMPFVEFSERICALLGEITLPGYEAQLEAMRKLCADYKGNLRKMRDTLEQARHHNLTQQEKKIITMLGEDYSNKEIAEALFISESTVKTHLSHAFGKLGIKKRGELRDYFRRQPRDNRQKL
jgi:LuxR family maltose regulon positive regulatory protein